MLADQRQEVVRSQQPAVEMPPSQQRLHPHDRGGARVELGLINQREFASVDRLAEFYEQF